MYATSNYVFIKDVDAKEKYNKSQTTKQIYTTIQQDLAINIVWNDTSALGIDVS